MKKGTRVQFCPKGHDTFATGRTPEDHCTTCRVAYRKVKYEKRKDYYREHPEIWRESNWRRYGITNQDGTGFTTVDYDRAYQIQQGKCAVCGAHQSNIKSVLVADHDHKTNVFRGLVCRYPCNTVIIKAVDDFSTLLESAKKYLNR